MWEKLTERARKAIHHAQEEAARFHEPYVNTEHLLLGLLREEDTLAAQTLAALGISCEELRAAVENQLAPRKEAVTGEIRLTPRGKRVIDLAYDEARQLNQRFIGTEHLLLGLLRERDGPAGRAAAKLGVELESAREVVERLQRGPRPDGETPPTEEEQAAQRADSVARLVAVLRESQQVRSGGSSPLFVILTGGFFGLLALLFLALAGEEWTGLLFSAVFSGMAYLCWRLLLPGKVKKAAWKLTQVADQRAIGDLITIATWQDRQLRTQAMNALTRLLPELYAGDAARLSKWHLGQLYATLTPRNVRHATPYVLAVIRALEQIGDPDAIPFLEPLANGAARTAAQKQVQSAALACLPYLQARATQRRAGWTLLRPAEAPAADPGTLLRPIGENPPANPAELLRAGEPEPPKA